MDFHPASNLLLSSEATSAGITEASLESQDQELAELKNRHEESKQGFAGTRQKKPRPTHKEKVYLPLDEVRYEFLTTDELAYYLRLKEQTIRKKHMNGTLGIDPVKIGGRLRWPIRRVTDFLDKLP